MIKEIKNYTVLESTKNILGEGLYLSSNSIYWLDIIESKLYVIINKENILEYTLPEQASAILKVKETLVYLASESGICSFDLTTNYWSVLANMPHKAVSSLMRANDGIAIDNTCYFFGTMEKNPTGNNGALYIATDQHITKIFNGIGIPNSFIRVNKYSFLVSDSLSRLVYQFTFNTQFSALEKQKLWLDLSDSHAIPDGGCKDVQGNIYIAMWGGACINKYDKNANLISTYQLPALNPTNCKLTLDGKSLLVTTARQDLTECELEKYPASGSLFKIGLF